MKKWLVMLLCLIIASGCAFAEELPADTRMSQIELEGMIEAFAETKHTGGSGYTIWYPSEYLAPAQRYGHDVFVPVGAENAEENDVYFMIVPVDIAPEEADSLLAEAVGGYGEEAVIGEKAWKELGNGVSVGTVQAEEDGVIWRFYLVTDGNSVLCITACFPREAAEGFGVRFDRMADTIEFESAIENDARYEGEGFAVSYPSSVLQAQTIYTHPGFVPLGSGAESDVYLMIVKSDVAPEQADSLLKEAELSFEGIYAYTEREEKTLASGVTLKSIDVEQGGMHRYYLIKGESDVYCLTAVFSVMDETDYGAVFDAVAESFELTEAE